MKMKVILVCGARPNFIKIAPLLRAITKHNTTSSGNPIDPLLVHTGQHYDHKMSRIFFQDLDLPQPDIHLGVGSGTHAEQTGQIMIKFEKVLFKEKPDMVVVVGDVNSTLAAALAAAKLHIPIAHVEAGERTYDQSKPEEINRLLTDMVSEYLFAATVDACENLKKEGIPQEKIFFVGNIMVDSLLSNRVKAAQRQILSRFGLERNSYGVLTLHRPGNVDDRQVFLRIISALKEVSRKIPIIFPAHPRTRKNIKQYGLENLFHTVEANMAVIGRHGLHLTTPLGYLDFLNLMMNSKFVLTDSEGIQAETTVLNVPCLTLYRVTDWTVTLKEGTNTLVGTDPERIVKEAFKILNGMGKKGKRPKLWDGRAAERIVAIVARSR